MKKIICSVYDLKVESYDTVFLARSTGEATRSMVVAAEDGRATFCKFPQDFELHHIGYFDCETGQLTNIPHVTLMSGVEAVRYANEAKGENPNE